jgi:septum formation protein
LGADPQAPAADNEWVLLHPPLVLASKSPRRKEILAAAGIPFTVRIADVPEERAPGEAPLAYVLRLAEAKAQAVSADADEIVLAADTVVLVEDTVLEKPSSPAHARHMLQALSGRSHQVLTGFCLRRGDLRLVDSVRTSVTFEQLDPAEIDTYVASGEPMDKAGAYAIQGLASKFVRCIEGCYFNVVGLPVSTVYRRLRELA